MPPSGLGITRRTNSDKFGHFMLCFVINVVTNNLVIWISGEGYTPCQRRNYHRTRTVKETSVDSLPRFANLIDSRVSDKIVNCPLYGLDVFNAWALIEEPNTKEYWRRSQTIGEQL